MNFFYNKQGIGDTLMIFLNDGEKAKRRFERKGDVTRIFAADSDTTFGYNLFNASKKFTIKVNGVVETDETLIEQVNTVIRDAGFDEKLTYKNQPDFVVGEITSIEKHPNADKLNVCQVDIGFDKLQIVCGAPNVEQGLYVVVATVGAVMPSGTVIKEAKLRGVASSGMICSARELALPDAPQEKGILALDRDRVIGDAFLLPKQG